MSSSQINLTWTDNSSAEDGYKIEQSPVDDLHFTQIGVTGPNATAYSATGLNAGTKYYYRVRAYNAIATSAYSSEKNATTLSSIPVAPSGLTITSITSGAVSLSWTDNSNNETGFKIQRKQGATGTYTQIATPGANVTTYTDSSALLDGTQYYYKVCATNSAGDSAFSNEVNGITTLINPTALTATAVSSSQINLTWTDNSSAEDGYKIEQSPVDDLHFTQIGVTGPNATAYSATGLNAGTKYYYRVRAYNAIATSAYSSEKNATTLSSIPVAPSGLTITAITSGAVSLAWTDNSNNETGFKIQRKQGATGTYTQIATPGANVTTYTDSSALLDGTQYYYKVCATNSAGDSAYSNEVNGTTPLINPSSLTATVVSTTQVNLNWTDNSRAETAYLIERKATSTGNYSQIGSVGMNVQSYADTYNFASGTAYYYRVRATSTTNGTIYSGYSNAPHVMPNP
ncbi:MAG: hypothetical protein DME90_07325 [Verrucomicrobia bacterium]|nr:MAG: hypothetical protein DME90_07325 [Verrucomicrobiota bacterium]